MVAAICALVALLGGLLGFWALMRMMSITNASIAGLFGIGIFMMAAAH